MVESASFADLNMSSGGVRITVKGLTYSVSSFKDKKEVAQLLTDVSGIFNPGEMTALLGPSGSGKTTFLDVLAGRKAVGETTGLLLYGGKAPTQAFIRRYTGYVEQFDTLISALTVREMLCYTAELKRPMSEPLAEKEAAVDKLLHELGLWTARDVLVGNTMVKGISGGQAKRTNIAIALITNPSVLFLDEPTSGLDSFTANEVMSVVKSLVTRDTTIIATVHSPTAYAFSLFNHAMILCSVGRVQHQRMPQNPARASESEDVSSFRRTLQASERVLTKSEFHEWTLAMPQPLSGEVLRSSSHPFLRCSRARHSSTRVVSPAIWYTCHLAIDRVRHVSSCCCAATTGACRCTSGRTRGH